MSSKAISVSKTICYVCQTSLINNNQREETQIAVYGCGHTFHSNCLSSIEQNVCLQCRSSATLIPSSIRKKATYQEYQQERPDLEGHF